MGKRFIFRVEVLGLGCWIPVGSTLDNNLDSGYLMREWSLRVVILDSWVATVRASFDHPVSSI